MGGASQSYFLAVLENAIQIIEKAGFDYAVIGGVATAAVVAPNWQPEGADIDILVKEPDAGVLLETFGSEGYATEKKDPTWLYKVARPDVTVDLIFRSAGDFRLDDEMVRRRVRAEVHGVAFMIPGPEDLALMKAIAHDEGSAGHWHDALRVLQRCEIDWDHFIERAKSHGAWRTLSLLAYAASMGLDVPKRAIASIYEHEAA